VFAGCEPGKIKVSSCRQGLLFDAHFPHRLGIIAGIGVPYPESSSRGVAEGKNVAIVSQEENCECVPKPVWVCAAHAGSFSQVME
jgi:hypothetical protein